jgi:hypothetical protein
VQRARGSHDLGNSTDRDRAAWQPRGIGIHANRMPSLFGLSVFLAGLLRQGAARGRHAQRQEKTDRHTTWWLQLVGYCDSWTQSAFASASPPSSQDFSAKVQRGDGNGSGKHMAFWDKMHNASSANCTYVIDLLRAQNKVRSWRFWALWRFTDAWRGRSLGAADAPVSG